MARTFRSFPVEGRPGKGDAGRQVDGLAQHGPDKRVEDPAAEAHAVFAVRRLIVDDEGGFTTFGVVIAMLLALSLVLGASRVEWVQSRAADVQFAADAGALASENVVANYMTVANVSDAIVFSMSLLGLSLFAVSAVAALVPAVGEEIAAATSKAAHAVMDARDSFAKSASEALETLQQALPYLCALNSLAAIEANGGAMGGGQTARLAGVAIPLPLAGSLPKTPDDGKIQAAGQLADDTNHETAELATKADDAQRQMNALIEKAWRSDCGNSPSYCLYQRAQTLSGIPAASNPYYASPDAWSFAVPLRRARAYYAARLAAEPGRDGRGDFSNPKEAVRSIARARFYSYALAQVDAGSVTTEGDMVTANLPLLPANTDDMRQTVLYTAQEWPLTTDESGTVTLHASSSCPTAAGQPSAGLGALSGVDAGAYATCPVCDFDIGTLGRVPAASTSIDNGFEHHWRIVAQCAQEYSQLSAAQAEESRQAKRNVSDVMDAFKDALSDLAAPRIEVQPPGRYGSIAVVVDPNAHQVPSLASGIDGGQATLAPRVALSAATLASQEATADDNQVTSLLASLVEEVEGRGGQASGLGAAGVRLLSSITGAWGSMLHAYSVGYAGIDDAADRLLGSLPGGSKLSEWASGKLYEAIDLVGMEPADLRMYKPVLCNSVDVATRASSEVSDAVLRLRKLESMMGSTGITGLVGSLGGMAQAAFDRRIDEGITITFKVADIEGLPEIPLTIHLPEGIRERGDLAIQEMVRGAQSATDRWGHAERIWR